MADSPGDFDAHLPTEVARIRQQLDDLDRLLNERFDHRDNALKLQAREVERRLEDLNHEAARINAAAAKSVSAEVYEAQRTAAAAALAALAARVDDIKTRIDLDTGAGTGVRDARVRTIATIGAIGTLFSIAVALAGYLLTR